MNRPAACRPSPAYYPASDSPLRSNPYANSGALYVMPDGFLTSFAFIATQDSTCNTNLHIQLHHLIFHLCILLLYIIIAALLTSKFCFPIYNATGDDAVVEIALINISSKFSYQLLIKSYICSSNSS